MSNTNTSEQATILALAEDVEIVQPLVTTNTRLLLEMLLMVMTACSEETPHNLERAATNDNCWEAHAAVKRLAEA